MSSVYCSIDTNACQYVRIKKLLLLLFKSQSDYHSLAYTYISAYFDNHFNFVLGVRIRESERQEKTQNERNKTNFKFTIFNKVEDMIFVCR